MTNGRVTLRDKEYDTFEYDNVSNVQVPDNGTVLITYTQKGVNRIAGFAPGFWWEFDYTEDVREEDD